MSQVTDRTGLSPAAESPSPPSLTSFRTVEGPTTSGVGRSWETEDPKTQIVSRRRRTMEQLDFKALTPATDKTFS